MSDSGDKPFPSGRAFLSLVEELSDLSSEMTEKQVEQSGERFPETLDNFGTVLSDLYQAASCAWGCRGGDHQPEWLVGRVVNEAMASYRLLRSAFYDESLVLTRSIGEIANLMWLLEDEGELREWRESSRSERLKSFSPSSVRKRLAPNSPIGAPISDVRYRLLCEIGSHPVPWVGPNLFSGGTRPILGHYVQQAGLFIGMNELAFATSMAAVPVGKLLGLETEVAAKVRENAITLISSIGGMTIESYDQLRAEELSAAARGHKTGPA